VKEQKKLIRSQFRGKLRQKSPASRLADSAALCERLVNSSIWEETRTVMFFAPMPEEPDLWPALQFILHQGLTVALPRFDQAKGVYTASVVQDLSKDLVTGLHGIREPRAECTEHPLNLLDLILVPGLAFDLRGRRLGRGAGYYDRLLTGVRGTTCGIAFDEQISGELPVEPHDVFVDCILTPTRWLQC
jgi:5-formyltetrahydrofolate cyclo-ligase